MELDNTYKLPGVCLDQNILEGVAGDLFIFLMFILFLSIYEPHFCVSRGLFSISSCGIFIPSHESDHFSLNDTIFSHVQWN